MSNKIILEDFSEGDGYYKVNLAYLSKEQVEEIEAFVSRWEPTDEDIKACIGMCLTDVNEQRFKDYGTNLRDCLAWLEKQTPRPQEIKTIKKEKDSSLTCKDERIKKALIEGLRAMKNNFHTISSIKIDDAIAWLESIKLK